jgi:hypothetical protein
MRRLLVALLLTVLPAAAFADEDRSFASIGLRASGLSLDGEQGLIGIGAALRLKLTPSWSVEGAADVLTADDPTQLQQAIPVSLTAIRYFLPNAPVSLYLLGGAGVTYFQGGGLDTSRVFGQGGVGLQLSVGSLALSGDVRYLVLDHQVGEPVQSGLLPTSEGGLGTLSLSYSF